MAAATSRDYPERTQPLGLVVSDVVPGPRLAAAARSHLARFQADSPEGFSLLGMTAEEAARVEASSFLQHVLALDRALPGYLDALGTTAEAHAQDMLDPGMTVDESVAAGLLGAAEGRYLQGRATREDLLELGCSAEEIEALLAEQAEDEQASACASST
jgi:hypothetical protein